MGYNKIYSVLNLIYLKLLFSGLIVCDKIYYHIIMINYNHFVCLYQILNLYVQFNDYVSFIPMHLPILCGVASLVCLSTTGRILKSLNDPSLWLRHVIANWPNRSRKSFLARKLNDRKSATNSTKFNCVSYIIEVVRAFICQGASKFPGIPSDPFLSFSLATHNKLRARYFTRYKKICRS